CAEPCGRPPAGSTPKPRRMSRARTRRLPRAGEPEVERRNFKCAFAIAHAPSEPLGCVIRRIPLLGATAYVDAHWTPITSTGSAVASQPSRYTRRMRIASRLLPVLLVSLLATGCISIDLTPRIKPLKERTVEGSGRAKIVLTDISGFLSEEGQSQTLVIGAPSPRVGLLVRFREELKKAAEDSDVKALIVRINSPGGTVTASDIMFREP